jgi:DUF4097 and DUF4098 domain-containing protein YvlB
MRTESFATPGSVRLRITIPAGEVELETADVSETTVELEADGVEEEVLVESRPRGDGHEVVVDADRVKRRLLRSAEVRLRVLAPHGADVETNLGSADLRARGSYGRVDANIASGDAQLERVASANVNSASGDLRIDEATGEVKVNSASGDVDLRSVVSGEVKVQTASGDVSVGIAAGSRLWVDAQTLSGDTSSELELEGAPADDDGPLVELRVQSMSGDIAVRRA